MAAAGTSPALNLREKLAELAGLKQRVSPDLVRVDFGNLVTNGGFDTDTTGWTGTSATLSVVSGEMQVLSTASYGYAEQSVGTKKGCSYAAKGFLKAGTLPGLFEVYQPSGGSVTQTVVSGSADVSLVFSATGTSVSLRVKAQSPSTGTAFIDNVSLYEADPSDDAPWLRLPFGYKVGTRGMIVRDGVVLHPSDYTEITDSGQTWIKPIVAPGVSTEFSIWAGA